MTAHDLHFEDSEVARVSVDGARVTIAWAAAQVYHAGPDTGGGDRRGYVRTLVTELHGARIESGDPADAIGRVWDGRLTELRSGTASRHLAVPCEMTGPLRLALDFGNRSTLVVDAESARFHFEGDPAFTESLAC